MKVLAFSGSSRKDSYNQLAVNAVTDCLRCEVTAISLKDLDLRIYDADDEAASGLPEGARKLRTLLAEHDGVIVGCPEYNGFMTPLLINAIDWATRSEEGTPDLSCFADKIFLIASTSPGSLGGLRSATHLRTMLSGIGAIVSPDLFVVPTSAKSFGEDGRLTAEPLQARARQVADRLLKLMEQLNGQL